MQYLLHEVITGNSVPISGVSVLVLLAGEPAELFEDDKTTPKANPLISDASGIVRCYIEAGSYREYLSVTGYVDKIVDITISVDMTVASEISLTENTSVDLSGLRAEFRVLCGIIDMSNSEVDKWLNRGIRFLDLSTDFAYSPAVDKVVVPINTWLVKFISECRVADSVWAIDSVEGKHEVKIVGAAAFREMYPNLSDNDGGLPDHCIFATTRAASSVAPDPNYAKWNESEYPGTDYVGMLLGPKTDQEYQIEVIGKFYSPQISDTNPSNWWTDNHSDTVLAAAMYKLSLIMFRNREGAADYLVELQTTTKNLDFDMAEREGMRVSRMEG